MALTQITEKGIKDGEIINADINASAAIAKSKLASLDIVNADVNASAAIAGTKISPNFGSQNIQTTGGISNAQYVNLSSTAPSIDFVDTNNNSDFMLQNANGVFKLYDSTNNADRLAIDSSGNIGIGITSPAQLLHLNTTSGDAYLRVQGGTNQGTLLHKTDGTLIGGFASGGTVGASANDIAIRAESGNNFVFAHGTTVAARIDSAGRLKLNTSHNHGPRLIVNQGGDSHPATSSNMDSGFFLGFTGSGGAALNMGSDGSNTWFNSGYANNAGVARGYRFLCGGSEKVRLDNSGHVNIGTTSNPLNNSNAIVHATVASGKDGFNIKHDSTHHCFNVWRSASDGNVMNFYRGSSQGGSVGYISINSTSTSYNTSSDYRLKENASAISDGITRLKTLKPYRFNFKADADTTVDGFFAHEVTAVPEAISGTKDETEDILYTEEDTIPSGKEVGDVKETVPVYQGIDQSKIVPLLTAALQEAITKIETLETKVAALEAA